MSFIPRMRPYPLLPRPTLKFPSKLPVSTQISVEAAPKIPNLKVVLEGKGNVFMHDKFPVDPKSGWRLPETKVPEILEEDVITEEAYATPNVLGFSNGCVPQEALFIAEVVTRKIDRAAKNNKKK